MGAPPLLLRPAASHITVMVGLLIAAVWLRWRLGANPDTSWLITLSERVLDGDTLYVDVLETNPPASVWLYLPFVWFGRVLSIKPELVVEVAFVAAAAASVAFSLSLARDLPASDAARTGILRLVLAGILLILPAFAFSEREHAVLIAAVPVIFGLTRWLAGVKPDRSAGVALGFCAGLVVVLKPHFAVAMALPLCLVILRERSLAVLVSAPVATGSAFALCYGLSAYMAHPAYFHSVAALVADTYLRALDIRAAATNVIALVWFALFALTIARWRKESDLTRVACLASIGFFCAAAIQGKGWPYHYLPAVATMLLAALLASDRPLVRGAAAALAGVAFMGFAHGMDRVRIDAALANTPAPRVAALTSDLAVAHPLVRRIGGVYVQSVCSLWISASALPLLRNNSLPDDTRQALQAAVARERDILRSDLRKGRPDMILRSAEGFDWLGFAREDAETAALLGQFEDVGIVDGLVIMRRRRQNHGSP